MTHAPPVAASCACNVCPSLHFRQPQSRHPGLGSILPMTHRQHSACASQDHDLHGSAGCKSSTSRVLTSMMGTQGSGCALRAANKAVNTLQDVACKKAGPCLCLQSKHAAH